MCNKKSKIAVLLMSILVLGSLIGCGKATEVVNEPTTSIGVNGLTEVETEASQQLKEAFDTNEDKGSEVHTTEDVKEEKTLTEYPICEEEKDFTVTVEDNSIPGGQIYAEFIADGEQVSIVETRYTSEPDGEPSKSKFATEIEPWLYKRIQYLVEQMTVDEEYSFVYNECLYQCISNLDGNYRDWGVSNGIDWASMDIPHLSVTEWFDDEIASYKRYLEDEAKQEYDREQRPIPFFVTDDDIVEAHGCSDECNRYLELVIQNNILTINSYNTYYGTFDESLVETEITDEDIDYITYRLEDAYERGTDGIRQTDLDKASWLGESIYLLSIIYGTDDVYLSKSDGNYSALKFMDIDQDGVITMREYGDSLFEGMYFVTD